MSLMSYRERYSDAREAVKLLYDLRQVCLILLISAAILIPTLPPIHKVAAQQQTEVHYKLLMDDSPVTTISIPVCEEFELAFIIELVNLPQGQGMVEFYADILWDGSQVEGKVDKLFAYPGWR
ncbi:MAG: hypothetical protein QXE79_03895 [Candidatus Bathyarchaeia archaeon]